MLDQLDQAIKAVCPIDGVTYDGRIDFQPSATAQQRLDAQAIVTFWLANNQTLPPASQLVVLTAKRNAIKAAFEATRQDVAVLRTAILLLAGQLRDHATKTNSILTAIDNAASLGALKTAVSAITDLPVPTNQQFKNAIDARIDAGDAD